MGVVVLVLVASAVAIADEGTGGPSWAGERRTTVRGGRTFHDDGSCGGFAPLAGTGGGAALRPASDGVHACEPPGLHGVCPRVRRRPAHGRTRREADRRRTRCADARAAHGRDAGAAQCQNAGAVRRVGRAACRSDGCA